MVWWQWSHKLTTDTDLVEIKPHTDHWHRSYWHPEGMELVYQSCTKCLVGDHAVSMFSVDNLFLVPYKWWSENLPKAQACFFIRNGKTAIGEGLYATLAIFTSVLQPESHWQELKIPSASSWYFIKRSKLNNLCPGSGHYTDQVLLMTCMVGSRAERQPHIHQLAYAMMGIWLVQTIFPW